MGNDLSQLDLSDLDEEERAMVGRMIGLEMEPRDDRVKGREQKLESLDIASFVKHIKGLQEEKGEENVNVIIMTGAGVSVSAGIPDFRSPGTGLYYNLEKYDLPYSEAIFDIEFFTQNPEPFFTLAKELFPGNFKPTVCHYFIKLMAEKGLLLRNYTQNIDTLERVAGIDNEFIVEAHGSFFTSHCVEADCKTEYSTDDIKERILKGEIPKCSNCGGLVKPDIVFFGENLPQRFWTFSQSDFPKCDALIVIGTSLTVHPFAGLVSKVGLDVPRLLLNLEMVGTDQFVFSHEEGAFRDVNHLATADEGCRELARLFGWLDELDDLVAKETKIWEDKFAEQLELKSKNDAETEKEMQEHEHDVEAANKQQDGTEVLVESMSNLKITSDQDDHGVTTTTVEVSSTEVVSNGDETIVVQETMKESFVGENDVSSFKAVEQEDEKDEFEVKEVDPVVMTKVEE